MKRFRVVFWGWLAAHSLIANERMNAKKQAQLVDKQTQSIPKDLQEAVNMLKIELNKNVISQLAKIKTDEELMKSTHHGLGAGIRNDWLYPKHSRLRNWFKRRGVYDADEMSGIIIEALWRDLRGEEYSMEKRVVEAQAYARGMKKPVGVKCPSCRSLLVFTKWVLLRVTQTKWESYWLGGCTKEFGKFWIWNRDTKLQPHTEEMWEKLNKSEILSASGEIINEQ